MSDTTEFLLEIEQRIKGDPLVTELDAIEASVRAGIDKIKTLEGAATATAKGLDKVASQIATVRDRMAAAMKAGDETAFYKAAGAMQALTEKQDALKKKALDVKSALDAERKSVDALSGNFAEMKKAEDAAVTGDVADAGKGLKKLGGPLGKVGNLVEDSIEGFGKLEESLGSFGAVAAVGATVAVAAIALIVVALFAVGAAFVAAAAKATQWAVGLANTQRNMELTLQAIVGSEEAGSQLADTFSDIGKETGLANDRLLDITRSLKAANVSAKDMPVALEAIAKQEAALGDSSGTQALIDQLKNGTTTAQKLADTMEDKFGGIVQDKMLGLDQLWQRFMRNVSETFGGLNIEPVLKGLKRLVDLFDANTESGKALKSLFETMFGPLEDSEAVFVAVERGFLYVEIAALETAIGIKEFVAWIEQFTTVGTIAEVVLIAIAVVLGVIGAVLGLVVLVAMGLVLVTFVALAILMIPVIVLGAIVASTIYGIYSAAEYLMSQDWGKIGTSIVDGLLGPLADPAKIIEKVGKFADLVTQAMKDKLKIKSPSKVFEEIGDYTAEGFAVGIEGNDSPQSALESMTGADAAVPSSGKANGGSTITGPFIFHGVKDAKDGESRLIDALIELLDGESDQSGAEAPA